MKQLIILLCIAMVVSYCDRVKKLAGIKNGENVEKLPSLENTFKEEKLKNINVRVQNLEDVVGTINQKVENTELAIESMESRVQQMQKQINKKRYLSRSRRKITRVKKRKKASQNRRYSRRKKQHTSKYRYYIQVGAYKKKSNALALQNHMKKMGDIKFIIKGLQSQKTKNVAPIQTENYYDGDIAAHLGKQKKQSPHTTKPPTVTNNHLYKVVSENSYMLGKARGLITKIKRRGHSACLVQVKN